MSIVDILLGRPLASDEARAEEIGVSAGIGIFGLDALSSAAYGPEAALTLLIPLGMAGIRYIVPISGSIIVLLVIVYFSYRQTIAAYPGGGGSYTVARQNLGASAGLLAASALMIDYVLTVAVGISAGVGALISAAPKLQPDTVWICLGILALITLINLRGVREAGLFFMIPTYLFLGTLLLAIGIGITKTLLTGGHPVPIIVPHKLPFIVATPGLWLLLKVFASGCTAITGIEAVSNGTKAFRAPVVDKARRTLTVTIVLLVVLLAGIAFLVRAYGIAATDPGAPGYQSVLSMLLMAVAGRGYFYNISMASILIVLALSANTAFADFPRLCRAIARNNYLPHTFATRGRRLVYTYGISVLAAVSALLLILFGGVTDRLIPLYAIGAFLAFTLSQAGMVAHWRRVGGKGSTRYMIVNGIGATATGITVLVVLAAKFREGAWMTALLIPVLLVTMGVVRRHYHRVAMETRSTTPLEFAHLAEPIVILPVHDWSSVTKKAVSFAFGISKEIKAVHVDDGASAVNLIEEWKRFVAEPAVQAGFPPPPLKIVTSQYRFVIRPIVEYILEVEQANPTRQIAVLIPELVEHHWYHHLLHNKRASLLKAVLLLRGNRRIVVINVPWYLEA